ncbi:hypothetical protein M6B38_155295 [Iris pallida]|uniref:Uncharacterized protein n=1 Tax=Iris pallida TaxID=29817 RepID=A0AAX6F4L0_IRIPA|nr:hypothetical protein M6B38_155295 [Iris pallida]
MFIPNPTVSEDARPPCFPLCRPQSRRLLAPDLLLHSQTQLQSLVCIPTNTLWAPGGIPLLISAVYDVCSHRHLSLPGPASHSPTRCLAATCVPSSSAVSSPYCADRRRSRRPSPGTAKLWASPHQKPSTTQKEESGKPNLAMAAPPVRRSIPATGAAPHNVPIARACSPASRSHGRAHVDHPMLGLTDLLSGSLSDSSR